MGKTDLYKNEVLKISAQMRQAGINETVADLLARGLAVRHRPRSQQAQDTP